MTRKSPEADERHRRIWVAREEEDVDYLIGALRDPDYRQVAARFLGKLGATEATQPLVPLLDARDPQVRCSAARALGELGAQAMLPRLIEIAEHDPEPWVRSRPCSAWATSRRSCRCSCAGSGSPSGGPAIAAYALGELRDERAAEPLKRARRQESWLKRERYSEALYKVRDAKRVR